ETALLAPASSLHAPASVGHRVREPLESRLERAVNHEIAGAYDRSTYERRIDLAVEPNVALQALLERSGKALLLKVAEGHCRNDPYIGDVLDLCAQHLILNRSLRKQGEPAIVRQRREEIAGMLIDCIASRLGDELDQLLGTHAGA